MSFYPSETDIFGLSLPENFPALRHLCRAVELGGEGETQLLLGPLPEHSGPYYALRNRSTFNEETGEISVLGTHLEEVGESLSVALERLNPYWRSLQLLYVAPHLHAQLGYRGQSTAQPLLCTAVYRRCPWWPDNSAQDAYWLEGNLDQVREVMGQLMPDHQEQLGQKGHLPYAVLISADGSQRYAMPCPDEDPEEPWPPKSFEHFSPVPITDLYQIPETLLPVLLVEPVLEHYRALKQTQEERTLSPLDEIAKLTWPVMIMRNFDEIDNPEVPVCYIVYFVHGQGMEEDYWEIPGEDSDEQAVKFSILMRNLYRLGVLQGQKYGKCESLDYAVGGVRQLNKTALSPA